MPDRAGRPTVDDWLKIGSAINTMKSNEIKNKYYESRAAIGDAELQQKKDTETALGALEARDNGLNEADYKAITADGGQAPSMRKQIDDNESALSAISPTARARATEMHAANLKKQQEISDYKDSIMYKDMGAQVANDVLTRGFQNVNDIDGMMQRPDGLNDRQWFEVKRQAYANIKQDDSIKQGMNQMYVQNAKQRAEEFIKARKLANSAIEAGNPGAAKKILRQHINNHPNRYHVTENGTVILDDPNESQRHALGNLNDNKFFAELVDNLNKYSPAEVEASYYAGEIEHKEENLNARPTVYKDRNGKLYDVYKHTKGIYGKDINETKYIVFEQSSGKRFGDYSMLDDGEADLFRSTFTPYDSKLEKDKVSVAKDLSAINLNAIKGRGEEQNIALDKEKIKTEAGKQALDAAKTKKTQQETKDLKDGKAKPITEKEETDIILDLRKDVDKAIAEETIKLDDYRREGDPESISNKTLRDRAIFDRLRDANPELYMKILKRNSKKTAEQVKKPDDEKPAVKKTTVETVAKNNTAAKQKRTNPNPSPTNVLDGIKTGAITDKNISKQKIASLVKELNQNNY